MQLQNAQAFENLTAPLLAWYKTAARELPWRLNTDPYRVWVSEIMLQQTRVETVKPYYERFLSELPTIKHLAEVPEEKLIKLWEGLGYYSRAKNLKRAAQIICTEFGGKFPQLQSQLRTLPGIGEYTAGAIGSICFGLPTPAVDGNVLRVFARLTAYEEPPSQPSFKGEVTAVLRRIYPEGQTGDFTQSLMELGATVCLPNGIPLCGSCPVRKFCHAYAEEKQTRLPVKVPKTARRKEQLTVFLLQCEDRLAISKRPSAGLLGGLYELPNANGHLSKEEALQFLAVLGLSFAQIKSIKTGKRRKHIFTHIEWDMKCFVVQCTIPDQPSVFLDYAQDPEKNEFQIQNVIQSTGGMPSQKQLFWPTEKERKEGIALPTAFRQFLAEISESEAL